MPGDGLRLHWWRKGCGDRWGHADGASGAATSINNLRNGRLKVDILGLLRLTLVADRRFGSAQ